jgi:hypothetical protein
VIALATFVIGLIVMPETKDRDVVRREPQASSLMRIHLVVASRTIRRGVDCFTSFAMTRRV